jgi:hypothetical protein
MSPYRPGERSAAWLKRKQKLSFEVIVTGGSAKRIAQGDWGEAVILERDGRVGPSWSCWAVMPSGLLRHPLFLCWV